MRKSISPRCFRFLDAALIALQGLAFWPVWSWYVTRMLDGSDEPWGILALLTGVWFVASKPLSPATSAPPPLLALVPLVLYAIFYPLLPFLLRAFLAVTSITLSISSLRLGKTFHLGLGALLLLSLPLLASLQFYLGYPLRVLTGEIVAQLLCIAGQTVSAQGTTLLWRGDFISIDAPCSGIKMLWGGLYVCFSLACFAGLSNRSTWLAYTFAAACIFLANVSRTFLLFFSESKIWQLPQWFHAFAGLSCFACAVLLIALFMRRMQRHAQNHTLA